MRSIKFIHNETNLFLVFYPVFTSFNLIYTQRILQWDIAHAQVSRLRIFHYSHYMYTYIFMLIYNVKLLN